MIRGYLTVFLSLSLTVLIGFIVMLLGLSASVSGRSQFEEALDIGLNSVLAEYNRSLLERFHLLYVDASYTGMLPSTETMENRIRFYVSQNLKGNRPDGPWGRTSLKTCEISAFTVAAEGGGASMKNQAIRYVQKNDIYHAEADVSEYLETVRGLDEQNPAEDWSRLMEMIAGVELPRIRNERGEWEEVMLGNPADAVYAFLGSDILFLAGVETERIGVGRIPANIYISERVLQNVREEEVQIPKEEDFLTYLYEVMGNYRSSKEESMLSCQLEYIAEGMRSDYENLQAVAERILRWRFAENLQVIRASGNLCMEAEALAAGLPAVALKPELEAPVRDSLLYAAAFIESVAEVRSILEGGRAVWAKESVSVTMDDVQNANLEKRIWSGEGLCYEQYLMCMAALVSDKTRNLRAMDLMEMDIRFLTGSAGFSMDWCVEKITVDAAAEGNYGMSCQLRRIYGFY